MEKYGMKIEILKIGSHIAKTDLNSSSLVFFLVAPTSHIISSFLIRATLSRNFILATHSHHATPHDKSSHDGTVT